MLRLSWYPLLAACLATSAVAQEIRLSAPAAEENLSERLRANSLLLQEGDEAARAPQDIVAAARADYARLVAVLYDFGHFAPVVRITIDGREASSLSPFAVPSGIGVVEISVAPGPRYDFGTAEIGPLAPDTDLPEAFAPGGDASTSVLRDASRAAIEGWRAEGHAVAEIGDQSIVARHGPSRLDASIRVAPGPLVSFGRLIPEGEERMRAARLVEIAGLPEGTTFSPEALARAQERLRDTGVFSAVALQEQPLGPGDRMDIVAAVTESPLRRFGAGAELSTDAGAQVTAYWLHRNLFGGAERLRVEGEIGGIGQGEISTEDVEGIDAELMVRLSRPATFTPDTLAYAEATLVALDEPSFDLVGLRLEAGVEHRYSPKLEGALGIGLFVSRFEDARGEREGELLYLPAELTWDNRNDALNPTAGVFLAGTAEPFVTTDAGPGLRATLDARGYLGFGEADRTVLAARAQAGSVVGSDIDAIPPDYLFYSGGSGTVRGLEYQTLGAEQRGAPSGGRSFAALSAELRQGIGDTDFGVVFFGDAGYVASGADFQDGAWHAGAGLGLRYTTPFGPIRVDLATPVRGDGVGEDIYLYIGIGQSF
ncbi:MAG: autotransporter assembly complex protein TamA [Roseicyclus sp.]